MSENTIKNEFVNFEYDQIERIEKINKLLEEARKSSAPVATIRFMNRVCNLDVIYVPISFPMYRLENGRTLTLQDEYLATKQDVPDDFFTRDANSPEAQSVQHDLLMKLSEIKGILKTFQDIANEQTEPLIITNTGFVVNGNRRLSCWRTLYFNDKTTYKHFEYIRVAVLPEADEKAIARLEADEQIAPDIKADYLWHSEARMIQKRIEERGEKKEDVAALYRMTEKDIDLRLEMLYYASQYLIRNNWERQWSKIDKDAYAFEQLVKERKRLSGSIEKSLLESLTFSLVTVGSSEGRIYGKVPEIRKFLFPIIEAVRKEIPEIIENKYISNNTNLLFDDLTDDEQEMTNIAQALVKLTEEEQKKVVEVVESVITDENEKERERKSNNYLIDQVKKAVAALENAVSVCSEEDNKTKGLDKLLDTIDGDVALLRKWLKENENKNRN